MGKQITRNTELDENEYAERKRAEDQKTYPIMESVESEKPHF